jgi:hypothetical protein
MSPVRHLSHPVAVYVLRTSVYPTDSLLWEQESSKGKDLMQRSSPVEHTDPCVNPARLLTWKRTRARTSMLYPRRAKSLPSAIFVQIILQPSPKAPRSSRHLEIHIRTLFTPPPPASPNIHRSQFEQNDKRHAICLRSTYGVYSHQTLNPPPPYPALLHGQPSRRAGRAQAGAAAAAAPGVY